MPPAALPPRYTHLRRVSIELNTKLGGAATRSVLGEGGRRLGLMTRDTLTLDTDDEIAVFMDYCLHDVRRHGLNTIERYLREADPPPSADEQTLLEAWARAWYSLFVVEAAEPGVGIHLRDLLRDQALFVVDIGLSQTIRPGMVLAARVTAPEGITMTTGAALPAGVLTPAQRARYVKRVRADFPGVDFANLSPEEAADVTAGIIRGCLKGGAAERIAYVEAGRPVRPRGGAKTGVAKADRPCPCGSGKAYRRCCGKR